MLYNISFGGFAIAVSVGMVLDGSPVFLLPAFAGMNACGECRAGQSLSAFLYNLPMVEYQGS